MAQGTTKAAHTAGPDLSNWTKARIEELRLEELGAIIRSTKPDGKFAREVSWAKAELLRRAAPDLLVLAAARLKHLVFLEQSHALSDHEKPELAAYRAAIARAEGRT